MSRRRFLAVLLVPCLTVLLIAVFVWPTLYKYEVIGNDLGAVVVRICRHTGNWSVVVNSQHHVIVGKQTKSLIDILAMEQKADPEIARITEDH